MSKGLDALKETAIQTVEALYGKEEPLRNNKINELLETRQFKCIEKELKKAELFDFICYLILKDGDNTEVVIEKIKRTLMKYPDLVSEVMR